MCEVCRTSRRASRGKTRPPRHCCLRVGRSRRNVIANTYTTHIFTPRTPLTHQVLTQHTSPHSPHQTHTSPHTHLTTHLTTHPIHTLPHTLHAHTHTSPHTPLTPHHTHHPHLTTHPIHTSPHTPLLLPHKLQLLVPCQLLLDGIVHPLDQHVLQAHGLQQVGHCGGVAEGVNGPPGPGLNT